ncbi:MAG TPA: divalent-cation tolerance protein CutA [Planctomycetota bacterium]|nr:divalent-cation tolerance protein CutA [Planctomycetota bacterium]
MARRSVATNKGRTAPAADVRVVLATAPRKDAARLARGLVEGRHAACVNLVPGVSSVYRWKGAVETAPETLLVVKTTARRLSRCLAALAGAHPYEVPEGIALAPVRALAGYAAWVRAEVR